MTSPSNPKGSPTGVRRRSRELALQILFQAEFEPQLNCEQALALYRDSFDSEPELWDYTKSIVYGVFTEKKKVDELIQSHSPHWKVERMGLVDRNILRIATYELRFMDRDIPSNVAINEAIEVAKRFGTSESSAFVNGILDGLSKTLHK
jgi:N utilization substance protein B